MTYEEALKKKRELEPRYYHEGQLYVPKIVPKIESEMFAYTNDLNKFYISDKESKKYSSDNEFEVRGYSPDSSYYLE